MDQEESPEGGTVATAFDDGDVACCTLRYATLPDHLLVYAADPAPGQTTEAVLHTLVALLGRWKDGGPERLGHYGVTDPEVLRWYQRGPLAAGVALSGYWGRRSLTYDPIGCVDLSQDPDPPMQGHPAISIIVTYDRALGPIGAAEDPSRAEVWGWLMQGLGPLRLAALRRLALDPTLDPDLASDSHLLALINADPGVRQFASLHVSGFSAESLVIADIPGLLDVLRSPDAVPALFGAVLPEESPTWSQRQCRRNARYAVAWTLANLSGQRHSPHAAAWVIDAAAQIDQLLLTQHPPHPSRDLWLYERALAEFNPDDRYGLGQADELDLMEFLRFAVLRWRVVTALGLQGHDRFYWLADQVSTLTAELPEVRRALDAPSPSEHLPRGVEEMPEWLYGQNHHLAE